MARRPKAQGPDVVGGRGRTLSMHAVYEEAARLAKIPPEQRLATLMREFRERAAAHRGQGGRK